jgi:hypothetical protein
MQFNNVEDVLATVPRSTEHVAAETELGDQRAREVSLTQKIAAETVNLGSDDTIAVHDATEEIARLEFALRRCRARAGELQRIIKQSTPAYATLARAAVAVQRRAAAERIKGALTDYLAASADLRTVDHILDSIGAGHRKALPMPF